MSQCSHLGKNIRDPLLGLAQPIWQIFLMFRGRVTRMPTLVRTKQTRESLLRDVRIGNHSFAVRARAVLQAEIVYDKCVPLCEQQEQRSGRETVRKGSDS